MARIGNTTFNQTRQFQALSFGGVRDHIFRGDVTHPIDEAPDPSWDDDNYKNVSDNNFSLTPLIIAAGLLLLIS